VLTAAELAPTVELALTELPLAELDELSEVAELLDSVSAELRWSVVLLAPSLRALPLDAVEASSETRAVGATPR
jgi:hypothetical protein